MMLFRLAARNLFRNLRRTSVSIITVALGVAALFLYDGFNFGIMNQYKNNEIHALSGHGQLNTQGYRQTIYEKPWEHWIDQPDQLLAQIRAIPHVEHVFPRTNFHAIVTNGTMSVAGRGTGIDGHEEADFFWTLNIIEGETLRDQSDGIILGVGLARALSVKIGDRLTLLANTVHGTMNGIDVRVLGIFHMGMKDADDSMFRIQRSQAALLLDTDKIEAIALGLSDDNQWTTVVKHIETQFPQLEAASFAALDEVYYQHAVDWLGQMFRVMQIIILVIITLGTTNTISFTVMERTMEIGNLRANGESVGEVLQLLLWEGVCIGILGAAFGLAVAWLYNTLVIPQGILMPPAPGLTRQYFVRIELQFPMLVQAGSLGLLTAILATLIAAWRRTRMPIAEALRHR